MSLSALEIRRHSPFARWLRTGRWLAEQQADPTLEVKFNPNHDPVNGQFTFANGGGAGQTHVARPPRVPQRCPDGAGWGGGFHGGGGGSAGGGGATGQWGEKFQGGDGGDFGGGGATGHWSEPASRPAKTSVSPTHTGKPVAKTIAKTSAQTDSARAATHITKNGYTFDLDASGRTQRAAGDLSLEDAKRSKKNQNEAGGADRRHSDDGGHFIATRFNGPSDAFNHFAQNANFNRGAYRTLEDGWSKDLKAGKPVSVSISASYPGTSKRPRTLVVSWTVDRQSLRQRFSNAPKGK